jgi:hypothetical protein
MKSSLLEDPALAKQMGECGCRLVQERVTHGMSVELLVRLYEQLPWLARGL